MATPFSEIYERAVLKFSDYDFLKLSESEREYILEKYLMSAQADFEKMCRIDLSQIDRCVAKGWRLSLLGQH